MVSFPLLFAYDDFQLVSLLLLLLVVPSLFFLLLFLLLLIGGRGTKMGVEGDYRDQQYQPAILLTILVLCLLIYFGCQNAPPFQVFWLIKSSKASWIFYNFVTAIKNIAWVS